MVNNCTFEVASSVVPAGGRLFALKAFTGDTTASVLIQNTRISQVSAMCCVCDESPCQGQLWWQSAETQCADTGDDTEVHDVLLCAVL